MARYVINTKSRSYLQRLRAAFTPQVARSLQIIFTVAAGLAVAFLILSSACTYTQTIALNCLHKTHMYSCCVSGVRASRAHSEDSDSDNEEGCEDVQPAGHLMAPNRVRLKSSWDRIGTLICLLFDTSSILHSHCECRRIVLFPQRRELNIICAKQTRQSRLHEWLFSY